VSRIEDCDEIECGKTLYVFTIDEVATWFDIAREDVVVWLRAGMPYVKAGDFRTGDGFLLSAPWCVDWVIAAASLARAAGDNVAAEVLRLPWRKAGPLNAYGRS